MNDKKMENNFFDPFSGNWMNTASEFWENAFKFQNDAMGNVSGFMNFFSDASSKSDNFFKMGISINKFIASFFSKPENLTGFAAASEVLPVLMMNISQNLATSFTQIQNILMEKSSRFGSDIKELNMDDFNAGIFTIWKELYKSDFQKFYNIPQLGIARNYQEQMNAALDTGNRFFMAFSELMNLLYIPVEKAGTMVMEKYQEMADNDALPDDPKIIYKFWIKALEGYYMQMLQSPEYRRALNAVINTHAEHKKARGKIAHAALHQLQIPTNTEMKELYKEIYLLKKKIRELGKKATVEERAELDEKANTKKSSGAKAGAVRAKKSAAKKTNTPKKPSAAKRPGTAKKAIAAKAKTSVKAKK